MNTAIEQLTKLVMEGKESIPFRGYRNKQKGYSIVVCPDGVAEYYKVYEVEGDDGLDTLCIDGDVEPTDNIVCWFMTGWIGMTWKESARIVQLMSGQNPLEAECLKHIYLHRGMDNGFREDELNHIWSSLFDRATKRPLPSMAHFVGSMYQYAFLAMLKKDFPEEYQSIKG